MAKKHKHIIILGGGLAGLATAALLEKAGQDYLLLEAQDEFGGLTRGQKEQDVWLDFGLKSIPVGDISTNPLLALKKKLGLSFAIETVTEAPLTSQKTGWVPFVGFGETKMSQAIETIEYYTQFPRLLVSNGWKTLLDELLTIIPESKRRNKSFVTKLNVENDKITGVVINGDDTLTADHFVTTFPPKTLLALLPAAGFQPKALQKILKSESLTALSLDLATSKRVTEHKNIFVLNSDEDSIVIGQFISNADPLRQSLGFQISTWLTFLTDEDGANDEVVSKTIKNMKKQIKKAFPAIFAEGSPSWERLLVVHGAMGPVLPCFHNFDNLLTIGGQIQPASVSDTETSYSFVSAALAGALAVVEKFEKAVEAIEVSRQLDQGI